MTGFAKETEVDLQGLSEERVPSPCRAKSKKRRKDEKKAKDLEILLTELLYESRYSYETNSSNLRSEQESESNHHDDLFLEMDDLEEYPWELDFCDWKNGKFCRRRGNLPHRTVLHSRNYSRKNTYRATLDKVNYTESENKKNLICYGNKKLKGSKVHLLKRDLRKAAKEVTELESKKNNVEKRLILKRTPRRESVIQPNAPTRVKPRWSTKARRNVYDHNQFVLRNDNADKLGTEDFLLNLISMQDREITPEDFDLLLQLDSFVEVKTVPKAVIDQMKTEKVENEMGNPCMICMEEYEMGETLKYLKCGHFFHSSCIRTWLTVNSDKCPLDGQEVR